MSRRFFGLSAAVAVLLLAGCTSNTSNNTSNTSPTPASSPTVSAAAPAILDPCQLVTIDEASALAGVTFNSAQTDKPSTSSCVYGAQTTNIFSITVAQADSAGQAQTSWDNYLQQAEALASNGASAAGITVNMNVTALTLTGADRAATGSVTASKGPVTIAGSAIYVLKGVTFFSFSDVTVNHAVPSSSALQAQAQATLGRIP